MTQAQKILDYIQTNGSITPSEAFNKLHIYRLGARIFELRQEGHRIKTDIVTKKNNDGDLVKFAVYRLSN